MDNREQAEGIVFFERLGQEEPERFTFPQPRPLSPEIEAALQKARAGDPLEQRFEELKLENLGIRDAILPRKETRLRSEPDDFDEPLESLELARQLVLGEEIAQ